LSAYKENYFIFASNIGKSDYSETLTDLLLSLSNIF
jgi:hypothetical protein